MSYEPANPIITWPCYEPAGSQIDLSQADLLQHVVIIGSTGSGKSTLLTSAIRQIISHDGASPRDKTGLLVLDAKADDIVANVWKAADEAGRSQDVWVFGPLGDRSFDLFGILRSFDDVDQRVAEVIIG